MNNESILVFIKITAHKAAEDYLLLDEDMNESIANSVNEDTGNEIIKRICEHANQNVYMSLLNNKDTNRGDIQFGMADYDTIVNKIKTNEEDMNEYSISPDNFKDSISMSAGEACIDKVASQDSTFDSLGDFESIKEKYNTYDKMSRSLETMKVASFNEASGAYESMLKTAKTIMHNGESIGDMAKIASRASMNAGLDFIKIAEAYSDIIKELRSEGHSVNEEITKVSSLNIDMNSDEVKEAIKLSTSISKYAAFEEMKSGVDAKRDECNILMSATALEVGR